MITFGTRSLESGRAWIPGKIGALQILAWMVEKCLQQREVGCEVAACFEKQQYQSKMATFCSQNMSDSRKVIGEESGEKEHLQTGIAHGESNPFEGSDSVVSLAAASRVA